MAKLSRQERLERLEALEKELNTAKNEFALFIDNNPYWFYEPNTGDIDDNRREFLRKWLKPDDMPGGRLDAQIDVHSCNADIVGAFGGNQGGKSVTGVIESLIWATGKVPERLKGIYPESKIPKKFPQYVRVVGGSHKWFL